jgi:DNA-binding PadR family transcriptional regulator
MPIHHAVLGLLIRGENYGYELKAQFEEAIGPQWGELSIGHIYQVLDRLERDGLVTSRRVVQETRPNRVVYRITKDGRKELRAWLREPYVREAGYRDDFFLKLFVASRTGEKSLREVIDVQRRAYAGELSALTQLRHERQDDPLVRLLIQAAILHTEANLRVVEMAGAETDSLSSPATRSAAHEVAARESAERASEQPG